MTTLPPSLIDKRGLISRKTVAQLMGPEISVWVVAKNERAFGIDVARVKINRRMVRYRALQVLRILRAKGFLE